MVAFERRLLKHSRFLVGIAVLFGLPTGAIAADPPVETRATHAIITDGDGKVLFEKNADEAIPPASMSKLMTAAVVLDMIDRGEISGDTEFDVSKRAWQTGGSKMFVLVDTKIRVEDLLKGLIVQSGNDAAVVLAENIAETDAGFADRMNAMAARIGLSESSFANPNGLPDPGQRMSVADVAKLSQYIWDNYPEFHDIFRMKEFTWSEITQKNRNPLVHSFEGAEGMKTGHTDESGYSLAATARQDDERRYLVLSGLESESERAREAVRMMNIAFNDFQTRTFFEAGDAVAVADVFGGKVETIPLRIDAPVRFIRHVSVLDRAAAQMRYDGPLVAPVREGDQVAVMEVTLPGEEPIEYPLYAAEDVREVGAISKMSHGLKILFTPPDAEDE